MPNYISLRDAARDHIPGNVHINSIRRWATKGVYGVRLRTVRFAGKRFTTDQWCEEFVRAVQAAQPDASPEHHQAVAQLDAMGV